MNHHHTSPSRRQFLHHAGAMSVAAPMGSALGLNLMSLGSAQAAGSYKALVCIFMYGGNDAYNTVLATDSTSWSAYTSERGTPGTGIGLAAPGTAAVASSANLNERLGGVLPITPARSIAGRTLALHPSLGGVRSLFNAKRLAILSNVGPLIASATTKEDYFRQTAKRPSKLKSHNDQQSIWQSSNAEGAVTGWGGRFMDALIAGNGQANFSAISISGNNAWLPGSKARSYQMTPDGPVSTGNALGTLWGSSAALQKMREIMRTTRDNSLIQREHAAVSARSVDAAVTLGAALPGQTAGVWGSNAVATADPLLQYYDPQFKTKLYNPLAHQLQAVARTIAARDALGMTRQVFFVGLGDFDTHDTQAYRHARNMAMLAQGLEYFDKTLNSMGVGDAVTTFTASDFGRTLASNGDGSDHGWGGHHFIMGGAVKGGDVYGTLPVYGTPDASGNFASPDLLDGGTLLPSTSVDQYAATLGRWFGVSDGALSAALPNLSQFGTRNLGFML